MARSKFSRRKATPKEPLTFATAEQDSEKPAKKEKSHELQKMDDDDWALGWTLWTAHRATTGSAVVPLDHPDEKLVRWVQRQKEDYVKFNHGESTFLSNDGFNMLSRMGFTWDLPTNESKSERDGLVDDSPPSEDILDRKPMRIITASGRDDWEYRYQDLVDFAKDHGNVNKVPPRSKVGKWITALRGQYDDYVHGKPSPLTSERVDMLKAFEFDFIKTKMESPHQQTQLEAQAKVAPAHTATIEEDDRKPPASKIILRRATRINEGVDDRPSTKRKSLESANTTSTKKTRQTPESAPAMVPPAQATSKLVGHEEGNTDVAHSRLRRSTRATTKDTATVTLRSKKSPNVNTAASLKESSRRPTRRSESAKRNSVSTFDRSSSDSDETEDLEDGVTDSLDGVSQKNRKGNFAVSKVRGKVVMTEEEYKRLRTPNEPQKPSETCTKYDAERNRAWHKKFCDLVEFKRVKGHTCVPKTIPAHEAALKPLSTWVYQMRQHKRGQDRGLENTLTKARLKKLNDIGFEWNTRHSQQFWHNVADTMNAESWEKQFKALLKFMEEDGTCLVPKVYPPNPTLSYWVARQRGQMRLKLEGKNHSLTAERERRLREVGFIFNTKNKETRRFNLMRRYRDQWDEQFDKLVQFKKEFGHTWIPKRYHKDISLAGWVGRLRSAIRHKLEGRDTTLSDERIERLYEIGFQVFPDGKEQEWKSNLAKSKVDATGGDEKKLKGHGRERPLVDAVERDEKNVDDDETEDEEGEKYERDNETDADDDSQQEPSEVNSDEATNADNQGDEPNAVENEDGKVADNDSNEEHNCKVCKVGFNSFLEAMAHEARCSGFTDKIAKSKK